MTTVVYSVGPGATIDDALRTLTARGITSLPVLDDDRVVGNVSEADLLRGELSQDPRAHQLRAQVDSQDPPRTVGSVMTAGLYVTRGDEDVSDLLRVMADHGWKGIPVVSQGCLVGVVSRSDVVHALSRPDSGIRDMFVELGRTEWRRRWWQAS